MIEIVEREPFSAEIRGFDPKHPETANDVDWPALLAKHRVLVFRNTNLTPQEQVDFLSRFGRVNTEMVGEQASKDPAKLFGKVSYVTTKPDEYISGTMEIRFHADYAFYSDGPGRAISLHGLEIEAEDPTIFADMGRAARRLPPALLEKLRPLEVVKCTNHLIEPQAPCRMSIRDRDGYYGNTATIRPVLMRHPLTGEEIVNICQRFTSHVCGMTEAETDALAEELAPYLYAEDNIFAHRWRQGDLIIWDNYALQHARGNMTPNTTRHLQRVMVHPWDGDEAEERTGRPDFSDPRWLPAQAA